MRGNVMPGEKITLDQFPDGTSPYTLAIAKYLENLPADPDYLPERGTIHALMNLVQGRMLEYLADRICREFDIRDSVLRKRIVTVLLGIFSDEFFALFRGKIDLSPVLVVQIARRIVRKESGEQRFNPSSPTKQPSDRLYPAIFRKYFEYGDLDALLVMIESDLEIQKIILGRLLMTRMEESQVRRDILQLLEADQEGVTPSLFMGYIKSEGIRTLVKKVQSGAWESEMESLKTRLHHMRGN